MANSNEILRQHLTNIKNRIAERMAASHRNASGRSVASLKVEVGDGHAVLWGAKSFLVMEKGLVCWRRGLQHHEEGHEDTSDQTVRRHLHYSS